MADIFISYKREDRELAERLAESLQSFGFDVWWDTDLLSGDAFRKVIREVINQCSAAIVLWSTKSVESSFVLDEAVYAMDRGKLCPARIEAVELPLGFGQTHTDDLTGWNGELTHAGFQRLVRAIETRVGRKATLRGRKIDPSPQRKATEFEAFKSAQFAGNLPALSTFLKDYPGGSFANFVRGQIRTTDAPTLRPQAVVPPVAQHGPFDLAQLHPDVRAAVERARDAEGRANAAASHARNVADKARARGVRNPRTGLGINIGEGVYAGDEYAGYYEDGMYQGVGVYTFATNAHNTFNGLRYEGEIAHNAWDGVGVFYWRNGDRHAGGERDNTKHGPGVLRFADGRRTEGEWAKGKLSGYAVYWSAQGNVIQGGIWTDGKLNTPLGAQIMTNPGL